MTQKYLCPDCNTPCVSYIHESFGSAGGQSVFNCDKRGCEFYIGMFNHTPVVSKKESVSIWGLHLYSRCVACEILSTGDYI